MIASLPMYARAENRQAHDALWDLIRDGLRQRGLPAPDTLDHETDHMEGWGREDLVLGQICNLPYRAQFRDHLRIIGCADYAIDGTDPGYYRSEFIVRIDDPAQTPEDCAEARFAYNEGLSNSGYGAPQLWAAERGFAFRPSRQTGSHRASMLAVANGTADFATIDAHTFWMFQSEDPETAAGLRVIGRTAQTPGMSFCTRQRGEIDGYFDAISSAIMSLPSVHNDTLRLRGIVRLPQAAFDIPLPISPECASNRPPRLANSTNCP